MEWKFGPLFSSKQSSEVSEAKTTKGVAGAVGSGVDVAPVSKRRGCAFYAIVTMLGVAGFLKGFDAYISIAWRFGPIGGMIAVIVSVAVFVFILFYLFREDPRVYGWIIILGLWSFANLGRSEGGADVIFTSVILLSVILLSIFLYLKLPGRREKVDAFRARFDMAGASLVGGWYAYFLTVLYAALLVPFFVPITVLDDREVNLIDMAARYGIVLPAFLIGGGTVYALWAIWRKELLWNTVANMFVIVGMIALFFQMDATPGIPDSTPNRPGLYPLIICPLIPFVFSLLFGFMITNDIRESEKRIGIS